MRCRRQINKMLFAHKVGAVLCLVDTVNVIPR